MPKKTYKITHQEAKSLMVAAIESAVKYNVPGAIAIVDSGGNTIMLESLDDTMSSASGIAIGKAATSAAFRRPTKDLEDVIFDGRTPMLVLNSASSQAYVPLKGGYPIYFENELVGAIAVAGTMDANMDEIVVLEALQKKGW
ncbi:hypothetical protein B4Q04_12395 [Zobellia sp. OII3]|uniref:GlcG/HbpS family heme-binding protein n=1 Tax=Zobellia sp. OII3 TaxID=2034520 RepID=UPI000B534FA8|nr:heme-binding protein [Zobellia sp. OII3]OWW25326.1 hypothetical protein B4Q04_12395 [Zobellia sp. OII3]